MITYYTHCRRVRIQEFCKYTFHFDNYLIAKLYCEIIKCTSMNINIIYIHVKYNFKNEMHGRYRIY